MLSNKIMNINKKDIIYIYKITSFANFAPCFDNNIFSLACCKGNIKNGGMRRSICKKVENKTDINIWILGIAGKELNNYNHNDIVYLAKVDNNNLYSWKDYSEKFHKRNDAIYDYQNGEMIRNNKNKKCHYSSCDNSYRATDCGVLMPNYCNVKQVVLAKEFNVFNSNTTIKKEYQVVRGYKCIVADEDIIKNISKAEISFNCKNPFV